MSNTLIEAKGPSSPQESDLLATHALTIGSAKAPQVRVIRRLRQSLSRGSTSAATSLYRLLLALLDREID